MIPVAKTQPHLKVLFFVEGFTDIRFVTGLSEICSLTLTVPSRAYRTSGLKARVDESGAQLEQVEIEGSRLQFQAKSLKWLWENASRFDVILAQEVLRGAFNATLVGRARGVPVVTYMGISPIEYFRCRRERGQIGPVKSWLGETTIETLMRANGKLATTCLAMGPYLRDVAADYCKDSRVGLYYGVDTNFFRPADAAEKQRLRAKLGLPENKFLIVLSSRISHEKDPETALKAAAKARAAGLDVAMLNLGGGFQDFLKLSKQLGIADAEKWVLGRQAVHPMRDLADYFRASDCMVLASLAEGAAFSTLEGLSCELPVIATDIGGMAVQLRGVAHLTPRADADKMAEKILWVSSHKAEAQRIAAAGRAYVLKEWDRKKAFRDLQAILAEAADKRRQ